MYEVINHDKCLSIVVKITHPPPAGPEKAPSSSSVDKENISDRKIGKKHKKRNGATRD